MTGREKAREIYKKAGTNSKTCFINMEAIEALPDEFDVIPADVKFDSKNLEKFFENVGSKTKPVWYPRTELSYSIAEKRGILGHGEKLIEYVKDEIDINPILMKPFGSEPTIRVMVIAIRVSKKGKVLSEDGTYRPSSYYTKEENFWNDALKTWLQEEEDSEGYTKKTWKKKFGNQYYDQYPKYDTVIKRRKSLVDFQEHALSRADSKSWVKVIRVLAGMQTGFKTEDLESGKLTFYKVVRSKSVIKLETAARIDAIRNGNTAQIESDIREVFEAPQIEAPTEIKEVDKIESISATVVKTEPTHIPNISGGGKSAPIPELELEPEIIDDPKTENTSYVKKEKDFHDMEYQERLEYLKANQYAEWDEEHKKMYLRDVLKAYVDERGPNRKILEKVSHALVASEHKIINWRETNTDDMIKFIKKIESQKNIVKLDHTLP